jgi:hypothetical protein
MTDLDTPTLPAESGVVLGYAPAFKQRQRCRYGRCLLLTALGILSTLLFSLVRPDLLLPASACQIILAVGGLAVLWLYRLIDLHARTVELTETALILRQAFLPPRRFAWSQIKWLTGDRHAGTCTLHLQDGATWSLPVPLDGVGRLWTALQRHLAERVDTGAWQLLLSLEAGSATVAAQLPLPPAAAGPRLDTGPRRAAIKGALWFHRAALLCFFIVYCAFVGSLGSGRDKYRTLAEYGQPVLGTVTGWETGILNGVTTYTIRYTFTVRARDYVGESYVPARMFRMTPVGAHCDVTYFPENPDVNCQGDANERLGEQMMARNLAIYVLLPILVFGAFRLEWEALRERRLVCSGALVAAQVLECGKLQNPFGGRPRVRYRFQTPEGELLLGEARLPRRHQAEPGELLPLVYDPVQPRRHLLLAACAWVRLVEAKPTESSAETLHD